LYCLRLAKRVAQDDVHVLLVDSCRRGDQGARNSEDRGRQKLKSQYEARWRKMEVNKLWLSLWLQEASIQSEISKPYIRMTA
jgi:hypothetical protein